MEPLRHVQRDLDRRLAGDVGEGLEYRPVEGGVAQVILVLVVPLRVGSALVVERLDALAPDGWRAASAWPCTCTGLV